VLPALEEQILRQAEKVLKEPPARAPLLANLLIGRIEQLEDGVEEEG